MMYTTQGRKTNYMAKPTLNSDILTAALIGFEVQKDRIDSKIAEIRLLIGGGRKEADAASDSGKPKRKVSAAARRRMAKAQRLRWKKIKAGGPAQAEAAKPKRVLSASARRAISAAQKARWAARKKSQAQPAAAKKAARKKGQKKAAAAPVQAAAASV